MSKAVRYGIFWQLHDPEATPVPSSGVAARSVENGATGEDCSAVRLEELDSDPAERVTLRSIEPAVIVWTPAEQDHWTVVDERYGHRPVLAKCSTLAAAEKEARDLVPRRRWS